MGKILACAFEASFYLQDAAQRTRADVEQIEVFIPERLFDRIVLEATRLPVPPPNIEIDVGRGCLWIDEIMFVRHPGSGDAAKISHGGLKEAT